MQYPSYKNIIIIIQSLLNPIQSYNPLSTHLQKQTHTQTMFIGTAVSLATLTDLYYLIKAIRKYKQLSKTINYLQFSQYMNIDQAIKLFENQPIGTKIPVIIKGILKANQNKNSDGNIFSAITEIVIKKSDKLKEYIFQRVPYRDVLSAAYWKRPADPSKISFLLKDFNEGSKKIIVDGCKNTDFTGILSEVKNFQIKYQQKGHALFEFFKSLHNSIMFLIPFKFGNNIGVKTTYYGIMKDSFGYVIGQAKKKSNGQLVIENPKFLTKQVSFLLNKLKSQKNIYRVFLIIFIIFQLLALYFLIKYLHKINFSNKLRSTQQNQQIAQNVPFSQTCIICYCSRRSIIFKPCKHYGVCFDCYERLGKNKACPVCKQAILGVIRIIQKPRNLRI